MKIEVLYKEVESILKEMLNKDVSIEYLGESSIKICILGCNFCITVDKVLEHKILLKYSTSLFGQGLILALVSMSSGVNNPRSSTLEIDLAEFHDIFNNICLESVSFLTRSIEITGNLFEI